MSTLLLGQVLIIFLQQMDHSPEISPCFEQVFALSTPLLPFFFAIFFAIFFLRSFFIVDDEPPGHSRDMSTYST